MKKVILSLIVVLALAGIFWYTKYTKTIQTSKAEVADLENHAISEEDFLADWAETEEWKEYRNEKEAMEEKQEWFNEEVEAIVEQPEAPAPIVTWSFNKIDNKYYANWWIEVIIEWDEAYIMFSEDFSTPNWPDLYVLLSKNSSNKYSQDTAFNIWPLTTNDWKQIYKVPREEFEAYGSSVKIWCRAFDVMFSVAALQ